MNELIDYLAAKGVEIFCITALKHPRLCQNNVTLSGTPCPTFRMLGMR